MAAHLKPDKSVSKAILFENPDPRHQCPRSLQSSTSGIICMPEAILKWEFNTYQWTFVQRPIHLIENCQLMLWNLQNLKNSLSQSVNVLRPESIYVACSHEQGWIQDFQKGVWYMAMEHAKVGHYHRVRECWRGVGDQRECLASCLKC